MASIHKTIERGFILDGRYRINEALGQGGMAYVYLAEDLKNGSAVALKMMRDELSDDSEFIRRFATEARAAASLDHPNIVQVLDYGQDEEIRYIVQEYVPGTTLKELIVDNHGLSWDVAVPLMIQIALGLEHAHTRGIIHRDMKPQNVLITEDMTAKVTDFGIARASIANTITLTGGMAFGSVHYFSPEQARGGEVSEVSDLYSLGLVLYEMLTGELPFDGESSVAVAIKQLQEMPVRPGKINPQIPLGLEGIIFKAIQKSPERRFQSVGEFVDELNRFMHNPRSYRAPFPPQAQNWSSSSAALTTDKTNANYDKIEELERNIDRRRRSRLRDTIALIIIIVLAIGGLFYIVNSAIQRISWQQSGVDKDQVVVKRYLGKQLSEVQDELIEIYGEKLELIAVKSETQEKGIIFEQEPNYGTKMKKEEAHLKLKYSVGQSELELQDVSDLEKDEAKDILENAGFNVILRSEYSEEIEKDIVIRSEPEGGSILSEGTRVILYVSRGDNDSSVPLLEGLTWLEAESLVKEAGFILRGTSLHYVKGELQELPPEARVILTQSPEAETELRDGSMISVEYGDKEDYLKVQSGIDLESEAKKSQMNAVINTNRFVVPNLIGKDYNQVLESMRSIWPADAPMYFLSTTRSDFSVKDAGAKVVYMSHDVGAVIDPYQTTFIVTFDRVQ